MWLRGIPLEIWIHQIIICFGLRDMTLLRQVCSWFDVQWSNALLQQQLSLRVPQDVKSLQRAVESVVPSLTQSLIRYNCNFINVSLNITIGPGVFIVDRHSVSINYPRAHGIRHAHNKYNCINVCCNMILVGAGCNKTFINGGLIIDESIVKIQNLKLQCSMKEALTVYNGSEVHCSDVIICKSVGVSALWINRSRCTLTDCIVKHCRYNGIFCDEGGIVNITGQTAVFNNCIQNYYCTDMGVTCGLLLGPNSSVLIHAPLTLQKVFHNNDDKGGRDYTMATAILFRNKNVSNFVENYIHVHLE
jgi:hypothetical protein